MNVQYSTDNKSSWRDVATVNGYLSSYMWKVPSTVSDNCFIRVSQKFDRSPTKILSYDTAIINSAIFNAEETRAISTSSAQNIVEWDLYENATPEPITVVNAPSDSRISSAVYIENNRRIVALDTRNNRLLYINSGDNSIAKFVPLPTGFSAGKLQVDKNFRFMCIQPNNYGNRLLFVNSEGEFIAFYREDIPITNVFFANENEIYISLLDNTIKVLSINNLPNIEVKQEYDFGKNFNLISTIGGSQDSRLLGVSFRIRQVREPISPNYPWPSDNMIYDKNYNMLFKNLSFNNDIAHTFDFNPTGTVAVLGFPDVPQQICIVDLTMDTNILMQEKDRVNLFANQMRGLTIAKTGNALLAYSMGENNCQLLNFSFPETVTHQMPFSIRHPILTFSSEVAINDLIIGTENHFTFPLLLCNTSEVVATLTSASFTNDRYFKFDTLANPLPIILMPGECKNISILVHPLDTGRLSDSLRFVACEREYKFPFTVRGLNRKLTLLVDLPYDFGEVCMYEAKTLRFELFRNDDTVDILINDIISENWQAFSMINLARDTILKPGETYIVEIRFVPNAMGAINNRLIIRHSNQVNVTVSVPLIGTGIGTFFTTSHSYLPFIPEIRSRTVTITNTGDAFMRIDSIDIQPIDLYRVNTLLPLSIAPKQTAEIEIEYLGNIIGDARLKFFAAPCVRTDDVALMAYTGNATLTIPQVNANPKDTDAAIIVNIRKNENYPYRGERFFYSEFEINPRIFYPKYATSKFGKAEVMKNEIVADKRIFGVRITGDFNSNDDELVSINGIAALCEVENSAINFVSSAIFFGDSVNVTYTNGIFQLTGLCPGRLLLSSSLKLGLASITPNPVSSQATLHYDIFEYIDSEIIFEIFDLLGNKYYSGYLDNIGIGSRTKTFDVSNLTQGSYTVSVRYENEMLSYNLNVIR